MRRIFALALLLTLFGAEESRSQTLNVEVDPIPYAFSGFSLSGGLNTDHLSYEIEVFGIQVPEAFHGNEGFTQYVRGMSAKADYYVSGTESGLFTGVDLDVTSAQFTLNRTGHERSRVQVSAGISLGYKVPLTAHLYVTPWAGLGYMINAEDVSIDGETFEQNALRPFPAISIGWQF